MAKTREEVEALKENWVKDPCWDIEDTEEFGDYREELLAFRKDKEVIWEQQREASRQKRHKKVLEETGVDDLILNQALSTFSDIELDVRMAASSTDTDLFGPSQVRATLLVAAQLKRIADALEVRNESDAADFNMDFMTKLYKIG